MPNWKAQSFQITISPMLRQKYRHHQHRQVPEGRRQPRVHVHQQARAEGAIRRRVGPPLAHGQLPRLRLPIEFDQYRDLDRAGRGERLGAAQLDSQLGPVRAGTDPGIACEGTTRGFGSWSSEVWGRESFNEDTPGLIFCYAGVSSLNDSRPLIHLCGDLLAS